MEFSLRGGLLTPIDDISVEAPTSNEFNIFLHFVNVLEGIKTQIKNVHWASLKLPNRDKRGAHLYLDDFVEVVGDFQDTVAESATGITGISFDFNTVHGIAFNASSTAELMEYIKSKTIEFYNSLPTSAMYAGIKSETETFINNIVIYIYRFRLTE